MSTKQYSRWFSKTIKNLLGHLIIRFICFRTIFYTILFLSILLIINGRPYFIFQSHLHIPWLTWLTNVRHIQPLECLSDTTNQPDWPRPLGLNNKPNDNLTVVIVTAQPEFKHLPLTLTGLLFHLDFRRITEVLFLVPLRDVNLLEPFLSHEQAKYYPWSIGILSSDILLKHIHTDSSRLQIMFKLVLAQIIQTEYYLILDSNCLHHDQYTLNNYNIMKMRIYQNIKLYIKLKEN